MSSDPAGSAALTVPLKHPMIAAPIYGGKIDVPLFHSLAAASNECQQHGWTTPYVMFRTLDSVITRARNACVAHFLQQTDCTDLLFVDGDISWDSGCFARLLSHDVDLVAGVYRSRGEPEIPIARPLDNEAVIDPVTGLMELAGVGTGLFRISRRCAEMMVAAYGYRWYEDPATAPGLKIPCLFDFVYEPHDYGKVLAEARAAFFKWVRGREFVDGLPIGDGLDELLLSIIRGETADGRGIDSTPGGTYFSEDYTFCRRWRALGGKVFADPQLTVHHTGEKLYSFRLISYLNREYRKQQAQTANGSSLVDLVKGLVAA